MNEQKTHEIFSKFKKRVDPEDKFTVNDLIYQMMSYMFHKDIEDDFAYFLENGVE